MSNLPFETTIIEGGATGADTIAKSIAEFYGFKVNEYRANWNKYGRAAGPIRNQEMLDKEEPGIVVAFMKYSNAESSRGTKDMIKRAKDGKFHVKVIYG
jgi:hypothetical protein